MALKNAAKIGVPATSKKTARKSNHTRVKIPHIPLDMLGRYSTGNVMAVTGWSHSTLYNRIKEGKFPPPSKSGSMNYWDTPVVRAALGL